MAPPESRRQRSSEPAGSHDVTRPPYPERLFDDLTQLGRLKPGARVLEIGCESGQATRALANRGCVMVCLELGETLAALARRNLAGFPGVRVVTGAFETWEPEGAAFDMVMAARSWHWLDSETRYAKAAEVLRPQGSLAVIGTHHVLPDNADPVFRETQQALEAMGVDAFSPAAPDEVDVEAPGIRASGCFGEVSERRYLEARRYSIDDYLRLLDTYSAHAFGDPTTREQAHREVRRRVEARPEKTVTLHYLFTLDVAHPRSARPPNARNSAKP